MPESLCDDNRLASQTKHMVIYSKTSFSSFDAFDAKLEKWEMMRESNFGDSSVKKQLVSLRFRDFTTLWISQRRSSFQLQSLNSRRPLFDQEVLSRLCQLIRRTRVNLSEVQDSGLQKNFDLMQFSTIRIRNLLSMLPILMKI